MTQPDYESLEEEVAAVLNRRSRENVSNTPDFILARVMVAALEAFESATCRRDAWGYPGRKGTGEAL